MVSFAALLLGLALSAFRAGCLPQKQNVKMQASSTWQGKVSLMRAEAPPSFLQRQQRAHRGRAKAAGRSQSRSRKMLKLIAKRAAAHRRAFANAGLPPTAQRNVQKNQPQPARKNAMWQETATLAEAESLKQRRRQMLINSDRQRIEGLLWFMSFRICKKKCGTWMDHHTWQHTQHPCKAECMASLHRLRDASDAVRPGDEYLIQYPTFSSAAMGLHHSNDKTDYNGMMFAGGVKLHGSTTFVARLCTHTCHVAEPFFDSTLILGELEPKHEKGDELRGWKHASEHWVPHDDGQMAKGDYVGPEDPRMDVVRGSRFLTVGMNVPSMAAGCENKPVGVHRMFFVPVDKQPNFKTCEIKPPEIDSCSIQKNWASLVPRGSEDVYYIYSARPLQIMRLQPASCKVTWVDVRNDDERRTRFEPADTVHGGTRYVFGGQVADGDLFWSVGHTPSPDYKPVLVGLLMRNATTAQADPNFELVGVSTPLNLSKTFTQPRTRAEYMKSTLPWVITTSIVDFDPVADFATITFQVFDRDNYHSQLFGAGKWLQTAYEESRKGVLLAGDQLL